LVGSVIRAAGFAMFDFLSTILPSGLYQTRFELWLGTFKRLRGRLFKSY
jgi:hypothetical protein